MERYAIYAGDMSYGGLHGMCVHEVIEVSNSKEAKDYAIQKSYEVIESFSDIYESIEDEVDCYKTPDMSEEDIAELRDDIISQDLDWSIWNINEARAASAPTEVLDEMFYDDPEGFIEKYCEELD